MQGLIGLMAGVKDVFQCVTAKWRSLTSASIVLILLGLAYYLVATPSSSTRPGKTTPPLQTSHYGPYMSAVLNTSNVGEHRTHHVTALEHPSGAVWKPVKFDPHGNDTLVFVHIQKTGGSQFSRHLVTLKKHGLPLCTDSVRDAPTRKDYSECPRSWDSQERTDPWLVCGKTVGWACGLHAFYTEFKSCLKPGSAKAAVHGMDPQRDFHYITLLRHPVLRYISEYLHVQRGARWSNRHECGGQEVTDAEMPPCYPGYYDGESWTNVSLVDFYSCESNWANNRQTMMIADLESVGCFSRTAYPPETRERMILESAMSNLANRFAYFALTEYMNESVLLFQKTFGMEFGKKLEQRPLSELHSAPLLQSLWDSQDLFSKLARVNAMDMQLYKYALQLFSARAEAVGIDIDYEKVEKEIQVLDPDSVAHTAKKFTRLKYDLPQ